MITLKQAIDLLDFGSSTYYFGYEGGGIDLLAFDLLDLQAMEKLSTLRADCSIMNIGVERVVIRHSPITAKFVVDRLAFQMLSATNKEVKKEFQKWKWFSNSDRGLFCSLYTNLFTEYRNGSIYNVMIQDNSTKNSKLVNGAKVHLDGGGYFIRVHIGGFTSKLYVNRITGDLPYPPINC